MTAPKSNIFVPSIGTLEFSAITSCYNCAMISGAAWYIYPFSIIRHLAAITNYNR